MIIGLVAAFTLLAAACGGDDDDTGTTAATEGTEAPDGTTAVPAGTTAAPDGTTAAPDAAGALAEFGESTDADPALVDKALGPVEPSDEASWNIVLASIARAEQELDQATIDKAMECWAAQECDTGTGGELVMGYADGGGNDVNVWRSVSHMEAVLQALSYPEIGAIVSTAANFDPDPAVAANDIRFLINRGVDFIVGYPDQGVAIADAILEAEAAGIEYIPFSAGWVGLPDQEGALVPGEDYLTVVGEDLCALGTSFSDTLNTGVGTGKVALLGGTPNNALSLGWQRCTIDTLGGGLELVNPPPNENTTTGDTNWFNPIIPDVFRGLLTADPDIAGYALRVRRRHPRRAPGIRGSGHPRPEPDPGAAHRRAEPVLRLGGPRRADLPDLVLGRRQLPVPDRGHRGDARRAGRRSPRRDRRPPRDA